VVLKMVLVRRLGRAVVTPRQRTQFGAVGPIAPILGMAAAALEKLVVVNRHQPNLRGPHVRHDAACGAGKAK
jgi:hypothetical protein